MKAMNPADALELAHAIVEETPAEMAECLVMGGTSALTRFAGNRVHQNVAEADARVSLRAIIDGRTGVASTNKLDADSLAQVRRAATAAARIAPKDPDFPGLPGTGETEPPDRRAAATLGFGPLERAKAAGAIVEQSKARGLVAAGKVEVSDSFVAVANSFGTASTMAVADVAANVLSTGPDGGSGWASFVSGDAADLEPDALGARAADLASRSAGAIDLAPGAYTVVLAHDAVATLLEYLAYVSFSAKSVEEGSSFMTGHLGETLFGEHISIADDACAAGALGLEFDFEGTPKRRTQIIEAGRVIGPVTDSYWAARTGRDNTGHALPAPNSFGPMALDLQLAGGDATLEGMIDSVERGIYVTRLHYVNIEEPAQAVLTGMTRDGTFLIENGELSSPVKNLRFTQSAVQLLRDVRAIERTPRYVRADFGTFLVPALLADGFEITGQTS